VRAYNFASAAAAAIIIIIIDERAGETLKMNMISYSKYCYLTFFFDTLSCSWGIQMICILLVECKMQLYLPVNFP